MLHSRSACGGEGGAPLTASLAMRLEGAVSLAGCHEAGAGAGVRGGRPRLPLGPLPLGMPVAP